MEHKSLYFNELIDFSPYQEWRSGFQASAPESNYDLLSLFIVEYFNLVIQFLHPDKTTADTRVR